MAERRMFTQKITDSDAFTEMPLSAQALYFHLNMHADDDGFLNNANKIRKSINASEDDLKLLMLKRFILPFESGVVVIKHWRMHNLLRKDRYNPTQYQEEFKRLELRKTDNAYTEKSIVVPAWQPDGNQMAPQDSIGKDSIDYIIDTNVSCSNTDSKMNQFELRFESFWNAYPKKTGKKKCLEWFKKNKPSQQLVDQMIQTIELWKKSEQWQKQNGQFIPMPYTWLNRGGWDDELINTSTVDSNNLTDEQKKYIFGF